MCLLEPTIELCLLSRKSFNGHLRADDSSLSLQQLGGHPHLSHFNFQEHPSLSLKVYDVGGFLGCLGNYDSVCLQSSPLSRGNNNGRHLNKVVLQ